jgi:hypothetical protein
MCGIEAKRGATFRACAAGGERLAPGELAHLAGELAGVMGGDRSLAVQTIAAHHINRALEHEPGWGMTLAHIEDDFAGSEVARRTAREALGCLDLARIEHGE